MRGNAGAIILLGPVPSRRLRRHWRFVRFLKAAALTKGFARCPTRAATTMTIRRRTTSLCATALLGIIRERSGAKFQRPTFRGAVRQGRRSLGIIPVMVMAAWNRRAGKADA